jgi:hypothetical protein
MIASRQSVIACFGATLLTVTAASNVHAAPSGEGPAAFAADLVQKFPDTLEPARRKQADETNRRLREAADQIKKAKSEEDRARAETQQREAQQELVELLQDSSDVIKVSIQKPEKVQDLFGPYTMKDDAGALIFHVDAGPGDTRFVTYDIDESRAEHTGAIWVDCATRGTTWALVGLRNIPVKRTTYPLEFKLEGGESIKRVLQIIAPETGRLSVTVLSDDTGKPTPAMVRITCKEGQRDRRPSNAIDLAPQFDGNGHASGHRWAHLPGPLGGQWWCVPGPFEMALPPGEYDIGIRHGVEHVMVSDSFTVHAGKLTGKTYRPRRWVEMRNLGWYSGDDHVHGRIMSDDDADNLMAWIQAEDIHVANIVKMGDILRTWFEQRGWGKEYRVIDRDYVLSPGQECPRTHQQIGHTLSMNTKSMVRDTDKYYLYDWVADTVHDQGGLWGYAHVCSQMFFVHRDMTLNVPRERCDFVELMQFAFLGTDLYYDFLNTGFKLTASAGSDVPWGGTVGEVRLYAYVGPEKFTADRWFEAVRRGRTFVTNGPMLEFTVDDAMPGDEIRCDENRPLTVKARAWGDPDRMLPVKLEIVQQGEVIRTATPDRDGQTELRLTFPVDSGNGFWIAARVEANDGTKAHTTPVYVIRKGLRFWKYAQATELIAKRMESLKQIEQIVAEARQKSAAGQLDGDYTLQQLAEQGPQLLERVEAARELYKGLQQTVETEKSKRGGRGG